MNDSQTIIEVKNLKAGYNGIEVLKDINFSVYKGEIFVIIGCSGSGKSTLLKHMIGLYSPISGDILIKGESIVNARDEEKKRIMRNFGVLYQSGALFNSYTIGENVALPLEEFTEFSANEIANIVKEKLSLVGLEGCERLMPYECSGGMKKRAGLARAMALNPEILFFDEPSAGLDPIMSAKLDRLILNIRAELNTTMVIVTHELDSIYAIADRVMMIGGEEKTVIAVGKPFELRESQNKTVREFFTRDGLISKIH
ncbi:MAG TPA: ATP-binding cassette domain-containing protein [Victivallales bacterium]|nr:ATP-binding cassette domain-containing protein [Victivallales bacterium]HRR28160.1 ATP-binding cassette domain-containing protein [Victivallales bacterium]HRU00274.1 ATP-binding cassette domain-containing protein [Victivallales bacterium]